MQSIYDCNYHDFTIGFNNSDKMDLIKTLSMISWKSSKRLGIGNRQKKNEQKREEND